MPFSGICMTFPMHAPARDHVRAGVSAQAMEWTKTRLVFSFASSTRYWTKLRSQCGATVRRKRKCDYPTNTAVPCPRRNGERLTHLVRYRTRIDRHDHIRHDSAHRIKRVHQRGVRNSLRHAGSRRSARRRALAAPARRLTRQASRRQRAIRESVSSWCFSPEIQYVNTHAVRDQTEARLPSEARAFFVNTRNSDTDGHPLPPRFPAVD